MINADYTVVIRSSRERTENLCYDILCRVFKQSNIIVINEHPFYRAVKKTLEIGLDYTNAYLITMDADVLVESKKLQEFIKIAEQFECQFYQIQSSLFDKFFYSARHGGPRITPRKYLELALKCIDNIKEYGRPESRLTAIMSEKGYLVKNYEKVLGIHDFEQSYFDIYRKAYQHSHKHNRYLPYFQLLWSRLAVKDLDYRVALHGIELYEESHNIKLDSEYFENEHRDRFQQLKIEEKAPILKNNIPDDYVENIIVKYRPPFESRLYKRINEHYGENRPVEDFIWKSFGKLYRMLYNAQSVVTG